MMFAGLWGLIFPDPPLFFLWKSVTEPTQDTVQWIIRLLGTASIIGGVILLYHTQKLPNDITAKRIGRDAERIKNAIIDMTQLYKSLVDDAITHGAKDYLPLIKSDVVFQKDIETYLDKGTAIRSYLALNPTNPVLEKLKLDS